MSIKIYFGVPGSGKTTLAAKIVLENLKRGVKTYSNVPIKGALLYAPSDIGRIDISDGEMIIDEAGIDFNNRKFKTLPQHTIEWFKLSRHYGIRNVHIFSQSYDDMDITLRRLADEIYTIKRTLIPLVFCRRRIKVKVGIDKDTHQIMDMYFFQFLGINTYVGFHYWHMFDSWSAPALPVSNWYYSSYPDFTIDKKHSRLIYKKLRRQGRLYYKLFHALRHLFSLFFNLKFFSPKKSYSKFVLSKLKMHFHLPLKRDHSDIASTSSEVDAISEEEFFRQFFVNETK